MTGHGVYANLESIEGNLNGELTLTLTRKSRKIVITNDASSADLRYKFNETEEFATLKSTETLSLYFTTRDIIISGTNVDYRIWVFG